MSKSELELWDWIYLSPIMMMLNQYYDCFLSEFTLLCFATVSIVPFLIASFLEITYLSYIDSPDGLSTNLHVP